MRAKKRTQGGQKEGRKRVERGQWQQHMKHVIMPKRGHTESTKEGNKMQKKRATIEGKKRGKGGQRKGKEAKNIEHELS